MTVQTHIIGCVVRDMKAIIFVNIFMIQIKCLFYFFDVTTVFFQLYSPTPFLLSWRFVQIINAVVFLYLNELSSPNTPCMYHQENQKWFFNITAHFLLCIIILWMFSFLICLLSAILHHLLYPHSSTSGSFSDKSNPVL